jgi:CDGSH-type Zn-finger protein/uncharacterized Fe-S cluster protein YjdI
MPRQDDTPEARHQPTAERLYTSDQVEISWEPSFCIHFGACVSGSAAAFDPRRRPWVDASAETPDALDEIIAQCPSGALQLRWLDGRPSQDPVGTPAFQPQLDGPLFVRGPIEVVDRGGRVIRRAARVALCRCGHSQNKPFCDDSHYRVGFQSNDPQLDAP